ncbi:MAG: 5-(carboxyamino)imidazole ribonucleotide mutase [Nitrospinota bacterium]|nr:5-(carboxyamino)imidazole ribonucleotide mutase [Nitrospinota bacterium]
MGSDSDYAIMSEASKVLDQFGVANEVLVTSAHRTPARTRKYVDEARKRGVKVLIAGAGAAAHLAGVVAAETILPVIGVPIGSSPLQGFDSLLSTAQMPGGVSVATMAIGKAGAKNAGILAVQMLALSDAGLTKKLDQYKRDMAKQVEAKSRKLEAEHG